MNIRRFLFFAAAFLFIAAVGAGLFLWNAQKPPPAKDAVQGMPPQSGEEPGGTLPSGGAEEERQGFPEPDNPPVAPENPVRVQLKQQARSYAEIMGSFSSQSNFSNLVALFPFSTEGMKRKLSGIIQRNAMENPAAAPFRGTQTRALKADIVLIDEANGKAAVEVSTQRREEASGGESRTYYQDIIIEYVKEGDMWLVDNAAWGDIGP